MKYNYKFFNKQDYKLGYFHENIEMVIYSVVCFFIPFLIGHPQLVVGIIVNSMLVLAGMNLKGYKVLPVIIMPSLGVLTKGIIFGPFTMFLVYMIPFIWIGNAILLYSFKTLHLHKKINRWITLLLGAGVKAGFLFGSAFVLFSLGIVPKLFLTTMGVFQFYTAIAGGFGALVLHSIKKKTMR